MASVKQVLGLAAEKRATMVDLKFMDFIGIWQPFTVPIGELKEEIFEEGPGFGGSSIRGRKTIHASDRLVVPDPATSAIDPFTAEPRLSLICNIIDPIIKEAGLGPRA